MFAKTIVRGLMALAAAVMLFATAGAASAQGVFSMSGTNTSLDFVTVGNPGNAADTDSLGAVGYTYKMGEYDVTLAQYCQFLNAVAATDTYGLYDPNMATDFSHFGISRSGGSGSYDYSVAGNGNMPVFDVSWGDAARFCNWLQNGQPTGPEGNGTTETGAYTLDGDTITLTETRNAGAKYFIPSQNEWYKAAYYKGGGTNAGYWRYATRSNSAPSIVLSSTGTNNANYDYSDPTNLLTPVGYFAASPGPYGTFDMGGDVWQWTEGNSSGTYRWSIGGAFDDGDIALLSGVGISCAPTSEYNDIGFRVAEVPEPGSVTLLVAGALAFVGALIHRRRRGAKA